MRDACRRRVDAADPPTEVAHPVSRSTDRRSHTDQRGQSLALITVFMMVLLGACALAIDVGSWYQAKRAAQAAADASALAGASQLPAGWSYAQAAATTEFTTNKGGADLASYQNVTVNSANDSVKVTVTRPSNSYFSRLFGIGYKSIKGNSTATVLSYTPVTSAAQVTTR